MLSWKEVIEFFAVFEASLMKLDAPGGLQTIVAGQVRPRDEERLLKLLGEYSKTKHIPLAADFSEGLMVPRDFPEKVEPKNVASYLLNFGDHCEIHVNSMRDERGEFVLNACNRRFCLIKEAIHVILRDEFNLRSIAYPDVNSPELVYTTIDDLLFLPFSIIDFDDDDYSAVSKIENYAEVIAVWLLYPLEEMNVDRAKFLDNADQDFSTLKSTFDFANSYKLPQRYVDILFRWKGFNQMFDIYRRTRDGF